MLKDLKFVIKIRGEKTKLCKSKSTWYKVEVQAPFFFNQVKNNNIYLK